MEQSHTPESRKYSPEDIDEQVDSFVQGYDMDAQRVRAVLDRIINSSWPISPSKDIGCILDEAVWKLGPTPALGVFEREDLNELWQRVYVFDYLCRRIRPLYTLDELAERTIAFIEYLKSNRYHLLETGYPQMTFPQSSWHSWLLGRLHCVKFPVEVHTSPSYLEHREALERGKRERDERGFPIFPSTLTYKWSVAPHPYKSQPVTLCQYEEAAVIDGIDPCDAQWIESLRPELFDLKLRVLQCLLKALRDHQVSELWHDCLQLFTAALWPDGANRLLALESQVGESDIGRANFNDEFYQNFYTMPVQIVDLTSLLTVIGHYEEELTIGRMHKTREYLTGPALSLKSYYNAIGQPYREVVDRAIDCYMSLEDKELDQFWPEFRQRVNYCLKTKFFKEVTICKIVKSSLAEKYRFAVQKYADSIYEQLQIQNPSLSYENQVDFYILNKEINSFINEGKFWKIIYKNKTKIIKDTINIRYIAYIIQHPKKSIHCQEIVDQFKKRNSDSKVDHYKKLTEEELGKYGMRISGMADLGNMIEPGVKEMYESHLAELRHELQQAENDGDIVKAARIKLEIEEVEDEIQKSYDRFRKPRKRSDPQSSIRKRVSRYLYRGFGEIGSEFPELAHHLKNSMNIGTTVSYNPEPQIDWTIRF